MPDILKCTILESGTVKIETDAISGPNHVNAEKALAWIAKELGGDVIKTRRQHLGVNLHVHSHDHDHDHEHAGH